jgi:SAM-dependent methyltransferase
MIPVSPDFACRSCGSTSVKAVLSLGNVPLANALVVDPANDTSWRYPLNLAYCPGCSLVQITETVDPEVLFGQYIYFSSYSDTMLAHSKKLVDYLVRKLRLGPGSLVMEIASNDGYLLQHFKSHTVPVLGIEPASNIAKIANEKGIPTVCMFFGLHASCDLKAKGKEADVILGLNVLAHIADLNGFVEGVRVILKETGTAVFEFPYVGDMIKNNEFDTIYHEHLCYYSLASVMHLFNNHGLDIVDAELVPIHGGSLRIYAMHSAAAKGQVTDEAKILLKEEKNKGITDFEYYSNFAKKVETLRADTIQLLDRLKRERKRVTGYGAAAKGSTLLSYYGIGKESIEFIVDRSPHKQGKYMPGNHIPIHPPEKLLEEQPDYVLLLTWNFQKEILEQQAKYRQRGGKFIIPVPEVKVL